MVDNLLEAETKQPVERTRPHARIARFARTTDARTGAAVFGLLILLTIATGADRALWRVADTNVRLELAAGLLSFALLIVYYRRRALAAFGAVEWLLASWLGVNVLSSLLFSPSPEDSLQAAAVVAGLLSIYFAVVLLVRNKSSALLAAQALVFTGGAVTLLGLADAALFAATGSTHGISLHRVFNDGVLMVIPMVTGSIWEPNLYGAFALGAGLVGSALMLRPDKASRRERLALYASIVLCFSGVVLSMTRTVWFVGVIAALTLALVTARFSSRRPGAGRYTWLSAAAGGIALGVIMALAMPRVGWATDDAWHLSYPALEERVGTEVRALRQGINFEQQGDTSGSPRSALEERIGELGTWESAPTLLIRQSANALALDRGRERLVLGWGTDSFRYVVRPEPHAPAWIPNAALHVFFDTGLVGLALVGFAVILAVVRAVRALARLPRPWSQSGYAVLGLLFACGALLLCYQMTDGTWMGFTWLVFALLVVSTGHVVADYHTT